MEKNNVLVIALLVLIIGFGAGYVAHGNQAAETGSHVMSNGMMMDDNGMGMGNAMDDMMVGLSGKTGDDFDKAFLSEMIVHHEGAVSMAKAALTDAKHPELKQMAQNIISAQTTEIQQMQAWQKSWYNVQQ
ncbi:DUF305 domain-containing protein [Patescibacteria group bacterium]|nr:DUF305 domain-containing protein [Patescibacteria group bacterium]